MQIETESAKIKAKAHERFLFFVERVRGRGPFAHTPLLIPTDLDSIPKQHMAVRHNVKLLQNKQIICARHVVKE